MISLASTHSNTTLLSLSSIQRQFGLTANSKLDVHPLLRQTHQLSNHLNTPGKLHKMSRNLKLNHTIIPMRMWSLLMPSTWMVVTREFMESHGLWVMLLSTIAMGQLNGSILGPFYTISTMSLDREIKIEFIFWTAQPHPATTTTSAPLAAWRTPSTSTQPWYSSPGSWSKAGVLQHSLVHQQQIPRRGE